MCSREISVSIKREVSEVHERHKSTDFRSLGVAGCSQRVALPSIGGVQHAVWVDAGALCLGRKTNQQKHDSNDCANEQWFRETRSLSGGRFYPRPLVPALS